MGIQIKRAYDPFEPRDGARFLVDRLWPRGVKKEALHLVAWLKEVAPSDELRRWFNHEPKRWEGFRRRYLGELRLHQRALEPLRGALARGTVTLVYSARDEQHNQAVVLRDFIQEGPPLTPAPIGARLQNRSAPRARAGKVRKCAAPEDKPPRSKGSKIGAK